MFITLYFYKTHLTIYLAQLIALLSTASFDPATPIIIKSFGIKTRFSKYSKAWAFAKALMYFTTGFLTFYFYRWFDIWGILGLLMFFSTIFCVSLYAFVPLDKMSETYERIMKKKEEDYMVKAAVLDKPLPFTETAYCASYLKKWVDK